MKSEESWIRLAITYPQPTEDTINLIFFEQDLFAILYAFGTATINEQDSSTLDASQIPNGMKRLLCYFENDQAVHAAEVKSAIEQKARAVNIPIQTSIDSFTDNSWKDGWKAYFKPAQVSPHIAIRAPWCEFHPNPGIHTIVIDPGMAFGTGLHETTQLCIKAIDNLTSARHIQSMLDVGCGSGVLAIAASLCGVKRVRGIDNDPVCIEVSKENAQSNHAAATFDATDMWDIDEQFDLVVANIISSVLISLKEDMKNATRPGGNLVLSGILTQELSDVEMAFAQGIPIEKLSHHTQGEWCSITFKRPLS